MKPLFNAGIAAFLLAAVTSVTIFSCKKGQQDDVKALTNGGLADKYAPLSAVNQRLLSKQELLTLAEDLKAKKSQDEIKKIVSFYQNLSVENHRGLLLAKKELALGEKSNTELVQQQVTAAVDYSIELNEAAVKNYNHGFNQLTSDQFQKLSEEVIKSSKYAVLKQNGGVKAAADVEAKTACFSEYYPTFSSVKWSGLNARFWHEWVNRKNIPGNDCDFEFRYDGPYQFMTPLDAATAALIASYGGSVSKRFLWWGGTDYDTGLLLGAVRVYAFVGSPNYVNLVSCN